MWLSCHMILYHLHHKLLFLHFTYLYIRLSFNHSINERIILSPIYESIHHIIIILSSSSSSILCRRVCVRSTRSHLVLQRLVGEATTTGLLALWILLYSGIIISPFYLTSCLSFFQSFNQMNASSYHLSMYRFITSSSFYHHHHHQYI